MPRKFVTDKVLVGDGADYLMSTMPEGIVDLIVTSPPYDDLRSYKGYTFDAEAMARGMMRALKPGGVAVWVVGDRINGSRSLTSFVQALMFRDVGFNVHDVMVYRKKNTPFMRSNAYTNCFEFMFVLSKGGPPATFNPLKEPTVRSGEETAVYNKGADGDNSKRRSVKLGTEKVRSNIWSYAVGLGGTTRDRFAFEHPAMFPEKLAEDHVLSWSNHGDLVVDPMCGAGTTLKAAAMHGRRYVGIDISEDYAKLARRRVESIGIEPRQEEL